MWSFDSESGLLMIVGEWPFPGFAGHVGPGDGEARRARFGKRPFLPGRARRGSANHGRIAVK